MSIKGLPEILLAVCLYSMWIIALVQFIIGINWVPILLIIRIFSSISLFIYARISNIKIKLFDRSLWKFIVLIGTFDVIAFSFISYGYSISSYVSIIAMLSSAFSLPTIILGRIFLNERTTIFQAIGSLVIVLGVMLLPFF
jgi:uncharacterized membrane protein